MHGCVFGCVRMSLVCCQLRIGGLRSATGVATALRATTCALWRASDLDKPDIEDRRWRVGHGKQVGWSILAIGTE